MVMPRQLLDFAVVLSPSGIRLAVRVCYAQFQKKTCDDKLKQLTAQVASAARQAGDATVGTARAAADAAVKVFDAVGGFIGFVIGALLAVVQFLLGPSWAA
jgi:hypothetical protein